MKTLYLDVCALCRLFDDQNQLRIRLEIKSLLDRLDNSCECDFIKTRQRAEGLIDMGFGIADAAHVAFAEQLADVFITCDDKLLKRCTQTSLHIVTLNPSRIYRQGVTMTTETALPEEQLIRQATDALINNLGIMEATRFLAMKNQNRIESVERHRLWQSALDKEEFFDEVFTQKKT